mmetsp:Transcript_10607/g.48730  ORF Transcript_10607/g.48730 Transcript_10607/m.48730 type:complete len:224 (+) Transcript_10607:1749-2420(+)
MSPSMSNSSVGIAILTLLAGAASAVAIPGAPKLRCHSALPASEPASHSPTRRHLSTVIAFMRDSWSVTCANISMHSPDGTPSKSRMYSKTSTAASHSASSTRRRMSATNQLDVSTSAPAFPCSNPCRRTQSTISLASAHCRVRPMPTSTDLYPSRHMSSLILSRNGAAGIPRAWLLSSWSMTRESIFSSSGVAPTTKSSLRPACAAARLNASEVSSFAAFQSA